MEALCVCALSEPTRNGKELLAAIDLLRLAGRRDGLVELCVAAHERRTEIGPSPGEAAHYLDGRPDQAKRLASEFLDWVLGDFRDVPLPDSSAVVEIVLVEAGGRTTKGKVPRCDPWNRMLGLCSVVSWQSAQNGPVKASAITAIVERALGMLDLRGFADAMLPVLDLAPELAPQMLAAGLLLPLPPLVLPPGPSTPTFVCTMAMMPRK